MKAVHKQRLLAQHDQLHHHAEYLRGVAMLLTFEPSSVNRPSLMALPLDSSFFMSSSNLDATVERRAWNKTTLIGVPSFVGSFCLVAFHANSCLVQRLGKVALHVRSDEHHEPGIETKDG